MLTKNGERSIVTGLYHNWSNRKASEGSSLSFPAKKCDMGRQSAQSAHQNPPKRGGRSVRVAIIPANFRLPQGLLPIAQEPEDGALGQMMPLTHNAAGTVPHVDESSFNALSEALSDLRDYCALESDPGRASWLSEIIEDIGATVARLEPNPM
ncbi:MULTISPECIES: hypothetical protein [unclassified Pseudomonas]|uniref:hypothetical protein n=1 Tax=unclassified Pseudomonas TaxID=196821 RepID=UPI00117BB011|nr:MULTISPECIES: hypothetical protein [unclassified Pseudomonas]